MIFNSYKIMSFIQEAVFNTDSVQRSHSGHKAMLGLRKMGLDSAAPIFAHGGLIPNCHHCFAVFNLQAGGPAPCRLDLLGANARVSAVAMGPALRPTFYIDKKVGRESLPGT